MSARPMARHVVDTRFEPSFRELNGILTWRATQYLPGPAALDASLTFLPLSSICFHMKYAACSLDSDSCCFAPCGAKQKRPEWG